MAGFVDGEGCFSVSIHPHPSAPHGWLIHPVFQVYQHRDNADILDAMRHFFGCGTVTSKGPNSSVMTFSVYSKKDLLERVIPFFDQHSLVAGKYYDYLRFREVVMRMHRKEHLRTDGFEQIVRTAFEMNARGKQRKHRMDDVLIGILRDCTPDIRS